MTFLGLSPRHRLEGGGGDDVCRGQRGGRRGGEGRSGGSSGEGDEGPRGRADGAAFKRVRTPPAAAGRTDGSWEQQAAPSRACLDGGAGP